MRGGSGSEMDGGVEDRMELGAMKDGKKSGYH